MKLKRLLMLLVMPMLLFSVSAWAQDKTVTGKVTDAANGSPLPGVSVTVKGIKAATQTAADGTFSLKVPASATTLTLSYVGYASKDVAIGNGNVSVSLTSTNNELNEVVVVGYGTQRKRDVTGAISKVTGDKVNTIAAPSFEAALQGKAAGVQVIQGSGLAGSGSVIRIRGVGSISAGGDPLYVVDGFPINADNFTRSNSGGMNQNPLSSISPNDIESIEVLKDAAAAGIYGSRGANGVILITTKRGKSGKPVFNYNNKVGFQTPALKPEFLNTTEWLQLRQEAWENDGNTGLAPLPGGMTWDKARNINTNWWDLLTRTGVINEHNLSATFGNKLIKNYIGLNYSDNQSYLKDNSFLRYGITHNADITPFKKLKIGIKNSYYIGNNRRVPAAWAGGLGDAMSTALPFYPIYNDDGSYFTASANPVRRLNETKWRNVDNRYIAGLNIEYELVKNLIVRATGNYENTKQVEDKWESANWQNRTNLQIGQAQRSRLGNRNWMTNFTANYSLNIKENHRFTFVAGAEFQERINKDYGYVFRDNTGPFWDNKSLYNQVYDSVRNAVESTGGQFIKDTYKETFTSYFARVNYTYKNRYNFQLSNRVDASSKFGPNNKYGWFPTAAFGWTVSEESFMKNITWINFMKFRASYGISGNSNIGSGEYYVRYGNGSNFNGGTTLYQQNVGYPDMKWENLRNFDLGIEVSAFKNRVTGEFSYFNKKSTDIFLSAGLSPSIGYDNQIRNITDGEILNEGFELSINVKVIDTRDLKLSVGGNTLKLYNELKSLGTLSPDAAGGGTNDTRVAIGYPIGTNYLVRYYGVDPNDGLPIWYDKSGKLTKTFSLDNRVPVGSVIPDWVGGFNHNLTYKNWEFSSLWVYTIGGNIYDGSAKRQTGIVTDWNMRRDILDRWRQPGDVTKYPRLTMKTSTYDGLSSEWQYNSTMYLYDASYLRLREITLAYNLPANVAKKVGLTKARIFVTGMNLLTFTKYPGGDPEIARDFENAQDRNLSPNITYLTPPQAKSIIFGVNVNF